MNSIENLKKQIKALKRFYEIQQELIKLKNQYIEDLKSHIKTKNEITTQDRTLFKKILRYMLNTETLIDGEWGSVREAKKIVKAGDMPVIYSEVLKRYKLEIKQRRQKG